MRTAHRLGIETVAVYSDADADATHVQMAKESFRLGPGNPSESYLCGKKIIEIAHLTKADAVHPGYGFLSENADFAEAVGAAGVIFVGPPVNAIRAMGAKDKAKAIMEKAGIPVLPGYYGDDQSDFHLIKTAEEIGYPIILKAALGGGGKGMRLVESRLDIESASAAVRREGEALFGNGRLLLEKYLRKPRHVEVQVFGDSHGEVVHLFERDCSLQRRHQKIIEEAPAPHLTDELRNNLSTAAINAAKAVDYQNAGTIEFLLDNDNNFYFMEMNTRLQVEHSVTELITGLDIVEWQFRIAEGEKLPLTQDEIELSGHAIEARVYAEDPSAGFMPSSGILTHLDLPIETENIRVECGVKIGEYISPHYDPMIAKIIVWDKNRDAACRHMSSALMNARVVGPAVNVEFISYLVNLKYFREGEIDTGLIERLDLNEFRRQIEPAIDSLIATAVYALRARAANSLIMANRRGDPNSPWTNSECWRINGTSYQHVKLFWLNGSIDVKAQQEKNCYVFFIDSDGEIFEHHVTVFPDQTEKIVLEINGRIFHFHVFKHNDDIVVFSKNKVNKIQLNDKFMRNILMESAKPIFAAPMPGRIVEIKVKANELVSAGQTMIILESMKMEHAIKAPEDGEIVGVNCKIGDQVAEGLDLLSFKRTNVTE